MSKLCDIKGMYGQDFGITVTNTPSNIIEESDMVGLLPKNMVIISSEEDSNNNDKGVPAIFATDYNGNPLRLTYAINTSNGLYTNDKKELQLFIDHKAIQENENHELTVNTNNLAYCSFNNLGVSKIAKNITSRNNSSYPTDTFISVDKNGVIYLSDSFISHIYQYIASKIATNIYPLIMDNIKGWLVDLSTYQNYFTTDKIQILSIDDLGNIIIYKTFTLYYKSVYGIPEEIEFDINNNEYPIKEVILNSKNTTVVEDEQSTPEVKLYRHSISFTIVFYPNYNLQNNLFLDNQYFIKIHPQAFDSNKYLMFYFNQNNVFDLYSNNVDEPFKIQAQTIKLNELNYNSPIEFIFDNRYKYFEDVEYILEIYYIKSNNSNNTDDAICIIEENINELIKEHGNSSIKISFKSNDGTNDKYNLLKDYLFSVTRVGNDDIIIQRGDSSTLYKYILRYTINGERTYTYEKTFNVKYNYVNLYVANNYMHINRISIYQPKVSEGKILSENDVNDQNNIVINAETDINYFNDCVTIDENNITIELKTNSISKLLDSISRIKCGENNQTKDIAILTLFANFNDKIFIENGGVSYNALEYSIWDFMDNIPEEFKNNLITHIHTDEEGNSTKPSFRYLYDYELVYDSKPKENNKALTILNAIDINEFMFQNSALSHKNSSSSKPLYYNLNIDNYHGPMIYITVKLDYAKFFKDNIKIFDITFGDWSTPIFDVGDRQHFEYDADNYPDDKVQVLQSSDDTAQQITNYANSSMYVGITDELYKCFNNINVSTKFTAYNDDNNIETVQIDGYEHKQIIVNNKVVNRLNDQNMFEYNGKNYHIFELNYSQLYFTKYDDISQSTNGKLYKENANKIVNNGFSKEINITYKFKVIGADSNNVNTDIPVNTFVYQTNFDISPELEHLEIIDE